MNNLHPVFVDESTLRFCPLPQIDEVVEMQGYNFWVSEEVVAGKSVLDCSDWLGKQIQRGSLKAHRITHLDDIRLIAKIEERCGVCRGEICSYVAAQRENGIVVACDLRVQKLLKPHIAGVISMDVAEFLSFKPSGL